MYSANEDHRRELAALRQQVKELEALRAEAQELPGLRALAGRMDALKKDAEDLPRLRGEVSRLRAEQQGSLKVQAEVQRLQGTLQHQQTQAELLRTQQAAPPIGASAAPTATELQDAQARAFHNACIANLKQIDGGKATWALENKKTGSDVPTGEELFGEQAYIRDKPVCPAGGAYLLRSVDSKPSCTFADHTL